MGLHYSELPADVLATLRQGGVIPAHPLALDSRRELDPRRQRALSRYYIDAGASGLAVGVHTTQFQIRDAGLYEPVLQIAADIRRISDYGNSQSSQQICRTDPGELQDLRRLKRAR